MEERQQPDFRTAFWQSIVRYQPDRITPWLALRSALGVGLPLAAGVLSGAAPLGIAVATGALNVSFTDSHGPYRQRAARMLAASVMVGTAVFAGGLSGHSDWIAAVTAGLLAFAAGMMVALSAAAADVGVISLVTLIVYQANALPVEHAAVSGFLAVAGGVFQTGLALAFWPLRRYGPERKALGVLYDEMSRVAAARVRASEAPPASAQSTHAQEEMAALAHDYSVEAERYRSLLNQGERMRLGMVALGRLRARLERERPGSEELEILERFFEATATLLGAIGESLRGGAPVEAAPSELRELQRMSEALRTRASLQEASTAAMLSDARSQMDALSGQLRSAVDMTAYATPAGMEAFARKESRRPWRLRLGGTVATLRANLSLKSAASRHAVRLAVCVAAGTALGRGIELDRSYWVPMTIAIVLKPDFTATFSRGLLRLVGTFVGLVVATGLFHLAPSTAWVQVMLIAALMFLLRSVGAANYGIFVTGVTAFVVLLIAMTGVSPGEVMAARAWNTAVGGVVAVLAYWLWPTWERTQVREMMAKMLDSYREYFRLVRESYVKPRAGFRHELDRARLAGRLARSNMEASLERLSAEPGTRVKTMASLNAMMASSHRMVHAMMALEAGLASSHPVPAREAFRPFADHVELTLYYLGAALRGSPLTAEGLPDLREDHYALAHSGDALTERYALVNVETDRITNSLNTLSQELLRFLG
ncbi:MAG: FUSC family protein [Bryobacterales bacterium]|nr:FUSC family protein [Bryobacterales bacterium]